MEGSGVCIACGAGEVELNDEQKCPGCAGGAAAPAEGGEAAPVAEAPAEAPAEGGDMPTAE